MKRKCRTGIEVFLGKAFESDAGTGGVGFILRKDAVPSVNSCISPRAAVFMLNVQRIRMWNKLPAKIVEAENFTVFKYRLSNFELIAL